MNHAPDLPGALLPLALCPPLLIHLLGLLLFAGLPLDILAQFVDFFLVLGQVAVQLHVLCLDLQ